MPATDSAGQRATAQAHGGDSSVQELEELLRSSREGREAQEPDWYLNQAFYVGRQWMYWNAGQLDQPILPKWRETLVDNRIMPIATARAARKVKNRPTFVGTPRTSEEAAVDAARITEKVLEADWSHLSLQEKLFQAILYAETVCAGFWKVYWDPTIGQSVEVVVDGDGEIVHQGNGVPIRPDTFSGELPAGLGTKKIHIGDVCVDLVSPFHFYPDPLATSMAELEWCVEEKIRSAAYVKQRYNVDLEPSTDAASGPVESRMFGSLLQGSGAAVTKGVRLFEFWARPSSTYPEGKRVVWAQNQILTEESAPFDPMPYVMFSGVKVPNRFWPSAITTQLRGPQVALNKIISQIQENANRIGNPALLKSRQANVAYSGLPGEEVLYDSTVSDAVPQYLQPPEVPSYLREQVSRIQESMIEISGLHEVSNATVPTGVTAASAINLLQEADDTRIGPEIQDMETSLGEAATKIARLRARYNTDERILRIAGDDGNWDIRAYRGSMMGDAPVVECQAGSMLPHSKAAKQAAMLEILQTMFQYGVKVDQRDLRAFFKEYEVGALDRLFSGLSMTEQQIQREHRLLSQGEGVQLNVYDDDADHVAGHEEFQRSSRYMQLSQEAQGLFEEHVREHRQRMVGQVNAQVEAQARDAEAKAGADQQREASAEVQGAMLDVARRAAVQAPKGGTPPAAG